LMTPTVVKDGGVLGTLKDQSVCADNLGRVVRADSGWWRSRVSFKKDVAVDRHTMLLIGSAIVVVLIIAYIMFGPGEPRYLDRGAAR
jgi:hypothetical protein